MQICRRNVSFSLLFAVLLRADDKPIILISLRFHVELSAVLEGFLKQNGKACVGITARPESNYGTAKAMSFTDLES